MKSLIYCIIALFIIISIKPALLKPANPVWVYLDSLYPGLKNDISTRIQFDKSQTLWMLTDSGFIRFGEKNYTKVLYPEVEFDAGQYVFDKNQKIWACGRTLKDPIKQHVAVFNGVNAVLWDSSNSNMRGGYFSAIALDSSGKIWVGYDYDLGIASEGGVEYIQSVNGSTWTIFKYGSSQYPAYHTNVIECDRNGIVWFGTNNGLVKYDNGAWSNFNTDNSELPYNDISAIAFDGSGSKWIGTSYKGVAKFDEIFWTVFNSNTSQFGSNYVRTVAVDNYDTVWVGTEDDGIKYWKSGNWWTGFSNPIYPQMPSNNVRKILIDKNNNKIIETDRGVVIFNEAGVNLPGYNSVDLSIDDKNITAYPNPFTEKINIRINLPAPAFVDLSLFNNLGIKVAEITKGWNDSGERQYLFKPKDLPAGNYFLKVNAGNTNRIIELIYLPD